MEIVLWRVVEEKKENYLMMEQKEWIKMSIWQVRCSPEIRHMSIRCAAATDEFINIS